MYIGKTKNASERWGDHLKVAKGGKKKYGSQYSLIHKSINKYGVDNFKFEIIQEYNLEDEAFQAEKYYIDFYKTYIHKYGKEFGYNISSGGEGATGYKHTEAHKKHISEIQSGVNHQFFGKHHTQKTKDQISKSLSGSNSPMYGHEKSDITKQKLSEANSILNKEQVIEIKKLLQNKATNKLTQKQIGELFGVGLHIIKQISQGKTWRHIIV